MEGQSSIVGAASSPVLESGVPGLDALLDGGLRTETACLIVGSPGTGKTTLGNQIAFHHARQGGTTLFATVLAERHERMVNRLRSFDFFDPGQVGTGVHYLSVLDPLERQGLDGVLATLRQEMRERRATLLVVDGLSIIEQLAPSSIAFQRFLQQLQATSSLGGWTTLLLSANDPKLVSSAGQHVDGIVILDLESVGARDLRTIRVIKLRGAQHLLGRHSLDITDRGMEVYPRLESLVGGRFLPPDGPERASLGITGLDAMLGGGLLRSTSTMMLGTPGSGKTLCGIHFIAEGAAQGERGLIATFHEPETILVRTAAKLGRDLAGPIADGTVRVLWLPPLELLADAWAWQLLALIELHRPQRLYIDGLSDIQRMIPNPDRMSVFVPALANELRSRGVTTLMTVELDAYVGADLVAPVPAASATMDTGILLRHVEVGSRIHRLVSVLKSRESPTDSAIREFVVGTRGIEVGEIFAGAVGLLTGASMPAHRVPPSAGGASGR